MEVVVLILKAYLIFVVWVLLIYGARHFLFTVNRTAGEQRIFYQDILDSDLPPLTVMVPMHNEEKVAQYVLEALVAADYPRDKLQILPINDHSTDKTHEIVDSYAARYPVIQPLHRTDDDQDRGKQFALNDALELATGHVIVVFDADYIPQKGALKQMAASFIDPEVGAVMGRVIPKNTDTNLLTRLLDLERSGGYQVDQQARHNLRLIPQYGGTVGAFRRDLVLQFGGFDPLVLAEDTDLTFLLFTRGWKILYANRVECYEESPESWKIRRNQIFRWARGHNHVMLKHFGRVISSKYLTFRERVDGMLLLCLYLIPFFIFTGYIDSIILFFLGEMQIVESILVFFFVAGYNTFGNFAPFYQIGSAALLDGSTHRIRLLPFLLFYFIQNMWTMNQGLFYSVVDTLRGTQVLWDKTERAEKRKRG